MLRQNERSHAASTLISGRQTVSDRIETARPPARAAHGSPLAIAAAFATLALGGMTAATLAADQADQTGPPPQQQQKPPPEELTEVVITGSRIARPEEERLQPTTVVTSDFIDQRGYTNVIEALSDVPAFGQPDNSTVGLQSAFGVAQSFANFFSLGSQRTLTLVDGRRFVPENSPSIFGATGNGGEQVDLNVIPTQLIDRIETVAVGGAPIYGSDAIAGTVNIILKHDFEGLALDAQGGTSDKHDASSWRLRGLAGKNFDDGRANLTVNVEYDHGGELEGPQRQQYADDIAYIVPPTSGPYAYTLINNLRLSSISTSGVPMLGDGYLNFNPNYAILNSAGQTLSFNSSGQLVPYTVGPPDGTGVYNIGGGGIDFAKLTSLLSPSDRLNGAALGNFKINDDVRLFGELWYSDTSSRYPLAQGAYDTLLFAPAGSVNGNLILNVHNPFLTPQEQATIAQNLAAFAAVPGNPTQTSQFYLARLNEDVENGGASADQLTRRAVLGIDGALPIPGHEFKYEVAANYGWSSNTSISPNINFQDFQNALNAVVGPGGSIVCAPGYKNSPVPTQSGTCAPFDPFGSGVASPAALAYVTDLARATSILTQRDLTADLNGDLFPLPAGPVKIALGYENRRESAEFQPDEFYQDAPGYLIPITPISGSFRTNEGYAETLVPFIAPAQGIPFVHRFEFEGAFREVDHSVAGRSATWTAGLRFEPVQILQFRGNYTRSIRAPSVTEAFLPTSEAFATASDPCDKSLVNAGPDPAVRAANCAKAGIVQPFTSNILSFTEPITVSGDPNLGNELADSRTYGFVLRPLERLSWTVDYVSIDISQAIVSLDATNVLDACYDDPVYPNPYCSQVTRSSNGQITLVKTGYANAGFYNFNGFTSELDYTFDVPFARTPGSWGRMDFRLNYFFANRLDQEVGSEDVSHFAGSIGNSKHRAVADLTWSENQLTVLWQTVFVGRAAWDNSLSPTNTEQQGVGDWWVHNVTLGFTPSPHLRLQLIVDNVFNKQAPFPLPASPPDSTLGIPNAIETYFSGILGRYFIASVEYRF
jgi:iron complex outermembrane recepter protein